MQKNRQMIAARAINLRADKAPFKIDEIIDFPRILVSKA
jgi:hypothetical protein